MQRGFLRKRFLESLYVEGLNLTRDRDLGREAVDTNVIPSLIAPNGAPSVKGLGARC